MTESAAFRPPGAQVGGLFVRLGSLKGLRDSLIAALAAHAITDNLPISAATGVVNEVRNRVRRLSDEELVVFDLLKELSAGAPYRVWAEQPTLLDAMVRAAGGDVSTRASCTRLLRSMKARGLLEESASAWRALW